MSVRQKRDRSQAAQAAAALGTAQTLARRGVALLCALQIGRLAGRLAFCVAFALFVGHMVTDSYFDAGALAAALVAVLLAAVLGSAAEIQAARSERDLAGRLREKAQDALDRMQTYEVRTRAQGSIVAGLQRHPLRLAELVVTHACARRMLAIGPLAAASVLLPVSWEAALTLMLALPVMILFLALLGSAVRARADVQEKAFGRIAAQFSDRIRSLPTILAAHGLARERGKIEARMIAYADSTMNVLRLAFLNAGVIDLFSALSIAVLAVFLGLGHLGLIALPGFSGLALWQSLFILMIAAEFFTPFRRYAEQYHLNAEGRAAAGELDWYFASDAAPARAPLRLPPLAALPRTGLIVLSGPSGAGKSTLLRMLAGIEPPAEGTAPIPDVLQRGCDWIASDTLIEAGTLADAIAGSGERPDRARLRRTARSVGLANDRLLPGGLDAAVADGGENLSGGQRMRIGVARALLSDRTVLADEPTAKLDSETAGLVRRMLRRIARDRLVIVATHDADLIALADRHHRLDRPLEEAIAA